MVKFFNNFVCMIGAYFQGIVFRLGLKTVSVTINQDVSLDIETFGCSRP